MSCLDFMVGKLINSVRYGGDCASFTLVMPVKLVIYIYFKYLNREAICQEKPAEKFIFLFDN